MNTSSNQEPQQERNDIPETHRVSGTLVKRLLQGAAVGLAGVFGVPYVAKEIQNIELPKVESKKVEQPNEIKPEMRNIYWENPAKHQKK